MLVSDYILEFLVKKKVKKVFLITGGAITFVVDAFSRNKKINYIDCGHEQGAAMMADAYSRLGPNFSATMVTSGPGAHLTWAVQAIKIKVELLDYRYCVFRFPH